MILDEDDFEGGNFAFCSWGRTSQFLLHSQCESRKVRMLAVAALAPFTRDRISPSRLALRITRTLDSLDSSSPSEAVTHVRPD